MAALRAFGAQIERGVLIRPRVRVHAPDRLRIGADSWIGENVTVANSEGDVRIGSNVVLSQSASLITHAATGEPMVIDDGAWIALRATVVGPVHIGRRAVIGAAATAEHNVAPGSVVLSPTTIRVDSLTQRP